MFKKIKKENWKTMVEIIKACEDLNPHLSASLLKKFIELQEYSSLKEFIDYKGISEFNITEAFLKRLGAEELEKTLGATPEDLKILGLEKRHQKKVR